MPPKTHTGYRCHDIYLDLRRQIDEGVLEEGERLPKQLELAASYSASVTTVNKVISRLKDERRVWARRGAGVFVKAAPGVHSSPRMISYMYMFGEEDLVPLQHAALANGHLLSVYSQLQTAWNPDAERLFLQQVRDQRHQALLAFCSPVEPRNDALLDEVAAAGVRVIHIEHYRPELPDQEYLMPDYQRAARLAAVAVARAGYRHIFYFGYADTSAPACGLHHAGLRQARREDGVPLVDDYVLLPPGHSGDLQGILARVPANSALVLNNARSAKVLQQTFAQRELCVPEDIGLIAIEAPGEPRMHVDTMSFQRLATTERAMRVVTTDQPPVRELVHPIMLSHGSLRVTEGSVE